MRVSRRAGREGDAYRSPDLQLQDIERWAKGNGVTLGKVVKEEDVSGARPVVHRGLEELIQRAQRGESRGVLVHRIDRFGRDHTETTFAYVCRRLVCAGRCDNRAQGSAVLYPPLRTREGHFRPLARACWSCRASERLRR